MSQSITFIYTGNTKYKASNVSNVEVTEDAIYYSREVDVTDTVSKVETIEVLKSDLLYAVHKNEENVTTVIPSIYTSFEVVPVGEAVRRQQNIEAEKKRVAAYRESKADEREAEEKRKYEARRQKRKEQYTGQSVENAESAQAAPKVKVVQLAEATESAAVKAEDVSVDVLAQLAAAGVSPSDLAVLSRLKIIK